MQRLDSGFIPYSRPGRKMVDSSVLGDIPFGACRSRVQRWALRLRYSVIEAPVLDLLRNV